ncbi:hypothetical protein XENOCAPTIV_001136, partial [Xenoophorus captivus]
LSTMIKNNLLGIKLLSSHLTPGCVVITREMCPFSPGRPVYNLLKCIIVYVFQTGKPPVEDLFSDLCDGRRLLELLEGLIGHELVRLERGTTRVHSLNNVNRALQILQKNNVDLVNIGAADIVDGNHKLILGLIWSIILHWQVCLRMHACVCCFQ